MNIAEMHIMFRQLAQQMGMQNVRAILPEQIDMCINASISDTINQKIKEHIGLSNTESNSKIGQINMFKNLYKKKRLRKNIELGTVLVTNSLTKGNGAFVADLFDTLYIIDVSVVYGPNKGDRWEKVFPVRQIDEGYFAETINDFILRPTLQSPIVTIYDNAFHLYTNVDYDNTSETFAGRDFGIKAIEVTHIARPAKVQYSIDYNVPNVDCDLPDYTHVDIVKRAVDMHNISLRSGSYSSQQGDNQRQVQDQRPEQESYQS